MSETEETIIPQPEIVLVGGSKDGVTTSFESGLKSVQNLVLNEDFTGPEYVDFYQATDLRDRNGNTIFVVTGRYNAEESKEFWESLDSEQVASFVERAKAEREEEEKAAEEAAAAEAETEAEKPADETETVQDAETGEVTEKPAEESSENESE